MKPLRPCCKALLLVFLLYLYVSASVVAGAAAAYDADLCEVQLEHGCVDAVEPSTLMSVDNEDHGNMLPTVYLSHGGGPAFFMPATGMAAEVCVWTHS